MQKTRSNREYFHFGKNLKAIRKAKHISQEAMAYNLNMSQASYSRLERQATMNDAKLIFRIAIVFDIQPDALMPTFAPLSATEMDTPRTSGSGTRARAKDLLNSIWGVLLILAAIVVLPEWAYRIAENFCLGLQTSYAVMATAKWTAALGMFAFILYAAWMIKRR
jgi:transcriptional regulator with XRE-family HTH domain